jgi:hypothetical protein
MSWAIVEVMGHRTYAGEVSEVMVAGVPMLRVTVPASVTTAGASKYGSDTEPVGYGHTLWFRTNEHHHEQLVVDLGAGSIFAITRCSEERVREQLDRSVRGEVVRTVEGEWRRSGVAALSGPVADAEEVDVHGTPIIYGEEE